MATKKQKSDLINALKFTPRDISIMLSGYGGEIVIGTISREAFEYWQGRDDLEEFAYDWDGEMKVPESAQFISNGSWHECDDICHENGVELGDPCRITVTDDLDSKEIWEETLDPTALISHGVTVECFETTDFDSITDTNYAFIGQSIEKGVFFDGRIRITRPFDPSLLTIRYADCDGWKLVTGVEYDGEEVEGTDGYSTNGKGLEFKVFDIQRDKEPDYDHPEANFDDRYDIGVLEGEEMWASEAIDTADEVQRWEGHELTPWWSARDLPVRPGRYQVLTGTWPFPGWATWTKKSGWQDESGAVENLKSWRGLANPPE